MSDTTLEFTNQLKAKRICRFCLTQEEPLTNIYSTENRKNLRAPLPLQIMACVSIEVFTNDEMPSTICQNCRLVMDYCYRFKQMCKRSDTMLKQFPLTGVWPNKLDHPKYPDELNVSGKESTVVAILPTKVDDHSNVVAPQTLKRKASQPTIVAISPPKKKIAQTSMKIDLDSLELNLDEVEVEFIDTEDPLMASPEIEEVVKVPPKILNKNNVKILNKQASSAKRIEPIIRQPILQTNEDGTIEIVSEIVAPADAADELDPIRNAKPVPTNVFPCEYCERSFPLRQLLDIHAANHVRDRNFTCDICQKGFFSKYDLSKHSLIHTGERPFKCIVCDKAFSRSTLLRRHEKLHTDHPKFLCAYCERPFLCKEEWEKHTLNHQKKRPFECTICEKTFAFKQGLERHEAIHAAVHPFKCEHCDKSFPSQGKLARHLTAHAGNRPYPCRLCNKSYLLSHHLTRHMRSHKEAALDYKCHECSETFTDRDKLIFHSANHATESLKCPLCKQQFDSLNDVTEHIKQHTEDEQYACEFCDSIFLTEEQLQEHSDMQHTEENQLYDNDDLTRRTKRVEVLETFTIVGDVLVPNNGTSEEEEEYMEYNSDANEEYTVIDNVNDSVYEDEQMQEMEFVDDVIKQEPSEQSELPPQRKSYGNAKKTASNKLSGEIKVVQTVKTEKLATKPVNTKLKVAVVSKPAKTESKSPTRQSERKLTNDKSEKAAVLPTKQSPKTRSVAVTAANVATTAAVASTSAAEKKSAAPSAEKKATQQTLTPWIAKKSSNIAAAAAAADANKETAPRKIISTRSNKSSQPQVAPAPIKSVVIASLKKQPTINKLPTNKPASSAGTKASAILAIADKTIEKKPVSDATSTTKSVQIGNKMVEVKQIRMTKAQIEDMKRQGKIKIKDGRLCIFKN